MYFMEYLTRTEEHIMYIMEYLTCTEEYVIYIWGLRKSHKEPTTQLK